VRPRKFDAMDSNDGEVVLFDEFCIWYTQKVTPNREIVDSTSQFVDEKRAGDKKGGGMRKDKNRLVIYSSDTPDKDDFKSCIKCLKAEYKFGNIEDDPEAIDAKGFVELIKKMKKKTTKGKGFRSIALACHGPPGKTSNTFCWEISERIQLNDDKELLDETNPVRMVMEALGDAVLDGGRVDLFACSLLGNPEGKEAFAQIEELTGTNFAASTNKTGNPNDAESDWVMESDNVDVKPLYFVQNMAAFDGTFSKDKFDELEAQISAIAKDPAELAKLWDLIDFNDNQIVSLAEIDKLMVASYPLLNHKPALMRAYKQTCLKEGGDGDAWVEPNEFPQLLMNLFYFNKLFRCFEAVDTDDDRRIDEKEFEKGIKLCGLDMDKSDAKAEFDAMDSNDGGVVLFDEYCIWYTKKVNPTREIVDSTSLFVGEVRGGKRKKKGRKKKKKGPKDAMPDYESKKFDKLEKELIATAKDPVALAKLWDVMDFNDNQIVSLAEIDKLMVQSYPLLNHKPALMRAYKQTCLREGGDGDAWVEPNEFPQLLVNLFYFNKLFQCFEQIDTDDDRRLDIKEFIDGLGKLGMNMPDSEAKKIRCDGQQRW